MNRTAPNIVQLRQLLAERFPKLRGIATRSSRPIKSSERTPFAELLEDGPASGALTEIVAPHPACGSSIVTIAFLHRAARSGQWLALVDAHDSFDPSPLPAEILSCLLWVRCRNAADALRAADVLLRDDNVPMAILDLRLSPTAQLRKIPSNVWYRLQRLIKIRSSAMVAITPFALVGSAQFRFALQNRFSLDDLNRSFDELVSELKIELLRAHGSGQHESEIIAHAS